MKTFWLTGKLGDNDIRTMVKSDSIDDLVSDWELAVRKANDGDVRESARQFVVENMIEGRHHTDQEVGTAVCAALLWFVVNGPIGEQVLPFMRRGGPNMAVHVEITKIDGDRPLFNFRTTVDEATSEQMLL